MADEVQCRAGKHPRTTAGGKQLSITATDLEVELVAKANVTLQTPGEITLPDRKLLDIIKAARQIGVVERRQTMLTTRPC